MDWGPPSGFAAKTGADKVLLAWEPLASPFGLSVRYQVFRSEQEIAAPGPGEAWPEPLNRKPIGEEYFLDSAAESLRPPQPNARYYYALIAVDAAGNSSSMTSIEVVNTGELCPPMALAAKGRDQSVVLSWQTPFSVGEHGLAGYLLFRSLQEGEQGEALQVQPLKGLTYTDRGTPDNPLVNGERYYYMIASQDRMGNICPPASQVSAVPHIPPVAPQDVTATGKTDDSIELHWTAGSAGTYPVAGYNLYRGTDPVNLQGPLNRKLVTQTSYLDSESNSTSKPILGQYYTYRVRTVDDAGNESDDSEPAQSGPRPPLEIPQTGILSTAIPGLPPESSLTISGRKKIDLGYTQVFPLDVQDGVKERSLPTTSSLTKGFNLDQELQVKLQGKVGKKISVDVDYDDRTEEQRKISIVYAGDPDEVIQEAAFGDIRLDLPRTEFAGYNKELFGAKLRVGLDRFRFTAIGAQTKGITVTEKFEGNASPRVVDIQDVNFSSFKSYFLTKDPAQVNHPDLPFGNTASASHGILPGSVQIYITNGLDNVDTVRVNRVEAAGNTRAFAFNRLSPGIDYTVDYERGIVTFASTLNYAWTVATAFYYLDASGNSISVGYTPAGNLDFNPATLYVPAGGYTRNTAHLLQDYNTSTGERRYDLMLMNRYSLGFQNILDPRTDPTFVIKIFGTGGEEKFIPQPSNPDESDKYYTIDPTFGTLHFFHTYPFQGTSASGNAPALFTSDNYDPTRLDSYNPAYNSRLGSAISNEGHNYSIHIELKNKISSFQLSHWNVIKNSEVIKKDGVKLRRDTDYFIDYDTGFITFLNPDAISASTDISVTYEYLPFGGKFQSNLFGARAEYDLIESKLSLGSTFLYNASQAPQDIPDIRSTPTSLSLIDGDTKLSLNPDDFSQLLSPLLGEEAKVPVSLDVAAEGAYSAYEINTYRRAGENAVAMVDNMDGSDNILSLPMDNNTWFASSAPTQFPAPSMRHYISPSVVYELGRIPVNSDDKKNQLRWDYNQLTANNWDGFVYALSSAGTNLHDYRYLEISVFSSADASQPVTLRFDLGVISEDSNGNGRLNFEGDRINLGPGEDVGINHYLVYENNQPVIRTDPLGPPGVYAAGAPPGYWGEGNNRLNTEDLDRNDTLDTTQSYYEYEQVLSPGWNFIKIPLTQFTRRLGDVLPTDQVQSTQFLSFIKHVRLWVNGASAVPSAGYVQFESIQLTGNKWQAMVAPGTRDLAGNLLAEPDPKKFNATAISLETDANYVPNTNFYIYDKNNEAQEVRGERALMLQYNLNRLDVVDPLATSVAGQAAYFLRRQLTLGAGYDYSGYRYLRVDVYKETPLDYGENLFIRLGIDDNNYYQYNLSLDEVPLGSWHTLTVELDGSDLNRSEHFQPGVIPSLTRVTQISIGVKNPNTFSKDEILWLNNLRVTDGRARLGNAFRLASNTKVSDILTVGTELRDMGSDFLTIDETPSGKQHATSSRVSAQMTQFAFLPVNVTWSRNENYTELEHRSDPAYSNSYATPDLTTEAISGDIGFSEITGLDLSVRGSRQRKTTDYISQQNGVNNLEERQTLSPAISYRFPDAIFDIPIGSTSLNGSLTYEDVHLVYDPEGVTKLARYDLYDRWSHSREERYTYNGSYRPIEYLNLSPSFTYSQASSRGYLTLYRFYSELNPAFTPDNNRYFSDDYRVARIERIAKLNADILNLPVLSPSAAYSMTNVRDYVNNTLSIPSGTLDLRLGLAPGDILGWSQFPKFNLSRSYNVSATFEHKNDTPLTPTEDPIGKLDFSDLWVINPDGFDAPVDHAHPFEDVFNRANINSKSYTDTVNSNINLFSVVTLVPKYSYYWSRKMNLLNFNTQQTLSTGANVIWNRIPSFSELIKLQLLNVDYTYTRSRYFDTNDIETSRVIGHNTTLTLPFRVGYDLNGNLALGMNTTANQSGQNLNIITTRNEYSGGISLSYDLKMQQPIRLPNFWPFNGAILKIEQALRISNLFNIKLVRNTEQGISGNELSTDTYTNDTTFDYALWRNVQGNLKVTNQWYYNFTEGNKNYYAIGLSLGLNATF